MLNAIVKDKEVICKVQYGDQVEKKINDAYQTDTLCHIFKRKYDESYSVELVKITDFPDMHISSLDKVMKVNNFPSLVENNSFLATDSQK